MREWCSCGAGIRSLSLSQVRQWRDTHRCPDRQPEPEPDKDGAFSSTERRGEYDFGGHPIGFTLNVVEDRKVTEAEPTVYVGTDVGSFYAGPGFFTS